MPPVPTFEELVPTFGFMTDRRIRDALAAGYLLDRHTSDPALIRHASYMLRLGNRVYVRQAGEAEPGVVPLHTDRPVLRLEPGATAHLYSFEQLRLPDNVLAFTVARGLLFAQPLVPENTYVDPGFSGDIYTIVTNITGRAVELTYKMPIARLFFYRLAEAVEEPYRPGVAVGLPQHLVEQEILEPASPREAAEAPIESLIRASSHIPIPGSFIHAELFARLRRRTEYLTLALAIWPLALLAAVSSETLKEKLGGELPTTVIATVVAALLIWGAGRLWDRARRL